MMETIAWRPVAHIDKYSPDQVKHAMRKYGMGRVTGDDFTALGIAPEEGEAESIGNLLTTAGVTRIMALVNASGGLQAMTNTATRIGVGNGVGTAAIGDTGLSASAGSTNQWWQIMDATFPSVAAGVLTAKSTFASADGNFAWNEWATDIGAPTVTSAATVNACMVNHKTSAALGTKTAGAVWAFTITITIA